MGPQHFLSPLCHQPSLSGRFPLNSASSSARGPQLFLSPLCHQPSLSGCFSLNSTSSSPKGPQFGPTALREEDNFRLVRLPSATSNLSPSYETTTHNIC